jgi:NAD-dependent dihydropyrimidine dehydrogenase PreA subunit
VLPDAESALKIIDLANEIGVAACSCRKTFNDGPDNEVYRCLGLNHAARVTFKQVESGSGVQDIRVIGKDEAKDLVLEQRQRGSLQSVAWRLSGRVSWLCNCDMWCGCHRTPELEWSMIPSFFVASPVFRERCEQCRECLEWCQRNAIGALRITDAGPVVDPLVCWGCGLCVEHCPNGVLSLQPREIYYDPITWKKKRLTTAVAV